MIINLENPTEQDLIRYIDENHIHIQFRAEQSYEHLFEKPKWLRSCPGCLKENEYLYLNMHKQSPALHELHGWFNFKSYYDELIKTLPLNANFLEIGVYQGKSLCYLGHHRQDLNLFAIDPFSDHQMYSWNFPHMPHRKNFIINNIKRFCKKVVLFDGISDKFVNSFSDGFFDHIYIDGDHSRECVTKDIQNYLPKVKKGGFLSGHDYNKKLFPDLVEVVDKILGVVTVKPGTVWEYKNE